MGAQAHHPFRSPFIYPFLSSPSKMAKSSEKKSTKDTKKASAAKVPKSSKDILAEAVSRLQSLSIRYASLTYLQKVQVKATPAKESKKKAEKKVEEKKKPEPKGKVSISRQSRKFSILTYVFLGQG